MAKIIGKVNPKLYEKMLVPFESKDEAESNVLKFFEAVRKLRVKYKMTDVHVIVICNAKNEDGNNEPLKSSAHYGDDRLSAPMCFMDAYQTFFEQAPDYFHNYRSGRLED